MKILPIVSALPIVIGGVTYYANSNFGPFAYAADAPTPPAKTEPATPAATAPVKMSPELMQADAKLTVYQTHMNVYLAQRDALDAQIKALQLNIDRETAMKEKLSK